MPSFPLLAVDNANSDSEFDTTRNGAQRHPPFSLQEFGDLLSSALDLKRVPESALEFSFHTDSSFSSTINNNDSSPSSQTNANRHTTSMMFRGPSFLRKSTSQDVPLFAKSSQLDSQSPPASRTPEPTRLRPSTSVPSLLNRMGGTTRRKKRVDASRYPIDLHPSDSSDGYSDPSPLITSPLTPASPPGQPNFRFPSIVPTWARSRKTTKQPTVLKSPTDTSSLRFRTESSPMSFLHLKPLPVVPKIVPDLPKVTLSPTLVSEPQSFISQVKSAQPQVSETGRSHDGSGSEGLRSFFDDSGFEEDRDVFVQNATVDALRRMKSRPVLRSQFPSSATTDGSARQSSISNRPGEGLQKSWSDRLLTRSPPITIDPASPEKSISLVSKKVGKPTLKQRKDDSSVFVDSILGYESSSLSKSQPVLDSANVRTTSYGGEDETPTWRMNSAPKGGASPHSRHPPSPFPSPSSPLPPTPILSPVSLPAVSPPNSDHVHVRDVDLMSAKSGSGQESVDSLEILSWRDQQQGRPRASPAASEEKNYARGFPSKDSIRTRLGLGPRLQVHIDSKLHARPREHSKSRAITASIFRRSQAQSQISSLRPTSGIFPSNDLHVQNSIAKLASASLVSLRSIGSFTGNKSVQQSEEEPDTPHRNAFEIDGLIALDPFAADPMTPHNTPVESASRQQSFMSLTNHSGSNVAGNGSSDCRRPVKTIANSRTSASGSTGWQSTNSSALLRPSVVKQKNEYRPARKTPKRHSGLPPSLVAALERGHLSRITSTATPTSPSFPGVATSRTTTKGVRAKSESRLHVNTVLGRVRKNKQSQFDSPTRLSSASEKRDSGSQVSSPDIIGHSSSRPHSPFPFLFHRSNNATNRNENSTEHQRREDIFPEDIQRRADTPTPDLKAVSALREVCVKDISNFLGDTALTADMTVAIPESEETEIVVRDIVSPTAWFLESEDEDVVEERSPCVGLGLKLTASPRGSESGSINDAVIDDRLIDGRRGVLLKKGVEHSASPLPSSLLRLDSPLKARQETHPSEADPRTESETETETEAKPWPLPPIRTFVVNEETGEGWHDVEPTVEYVSPNIIVPESTKVRHAIRSVASSIRSASRCSHASRETKSEGGSPTSRKISTGQARVIAEKLGFNLESASPPPSRVKRRSQSRSSRSEKSSGDSSSPSYTYRSRTRSCSNASAISNSSLGSVVQSFRTCKSGLSPARSSGSFRSSKSTSSSNSSSHCAGKVGRSSVSRANSFRSSRSSAAQVCAPSSFTLAKCISPEVSIERHESFQVQMHLARQRMDEDAIPQRIVLREESPANAMALIAYSWSDLMAFCRKYESLTLEAADRETETATLMVALDEVQCLSLSEPQPRMPGGMPDASSIARPSTHLALSMTYGKTTSTASGPLNSKTRLLVFTTSLPTTLARIADQSRESTLWGGSNGDGP